MARSNNNTNAESKSNNNKSKRSVKIPVIIAIIVVLLGAAGFAYANNIRLQAPAEIITEDGALYCLDGNGDKKVSCWIDFEGNRYYAGEDGKLYAGGVQTVGDATYCFGDDGVLFKDLFSYGDKIYSADADGKLINKEGWEDHDGKTYYNTGTGECLISAFKDLDGNTYFLGADGVLVKDNVFEYNGGKYYSDADGKLLKNQTLEFNGIKYYAGETGAFVKNGFTAYKDIYYYINDNCEISKEPVTLDNGYTVTPDPATGEISKKEYGISQSEYIYNGNATYIKVNIDSQDMIFVKDGELLVSSYIVSGMYDKYDTPRGTYEILYKARDVQLKGEIVLEGQYEEVPLTEEEKTKIWNAMTAEEKKDPNAKSKIPSTKKVQKKETWDVTVSYWLSFIGGTYGFHDATWRSYFGDYIYTYDGSHGCVNLPYWAAEELYNNADEGTPVFIV